MAHRDPSRTQDGAPPIDAANGPSVSRPATHDSPRANEDPSVGPAVPGEAGGTMHLTHRGVDVTVSARQNPQGAWVDVIVASQAGKPFALPDAQPITPEWLTREEALRAGVERACFLIDRCLRDSGPDRDVLDWEARQ